MSWHRLAACAGLPTDWFFTDDQAGAALQRHVRRAKSICAQCPVVRECRDWATWDTREEYGVLGGTVPRERIGIRTAARGRRP